MAYAAIDRLETRAEPNFLCLRLDVRQESSSFSVLVLSLGYH